MTAPATQHFDSTAKHTDTGMAGAWDNAFANLAGDHSGSAFYQNTVTAEEATAQHVAAGDLPKVQIVDAADFSLRQS